MDPLCCSFCDHQTDCKQNCSCSLDWSLSDSLSAELVNAQDPVPRTSTPLSFCEDRTSEDSVNDFFYKSWKSELLNCSADCCKGDCRRPISPIRPVADPPRPPVYLNYFWVSYVQPMFILGQPMMPLHPLYLPVGYRLDGTYGVLPTGYWPYPV